MSIWRCIQDELLSNLACALFQRISVVMHIPTFLINTWLASGRRFSGLSGGLVRKGASC